MKYNTRKILTLTKEEQEAIASFTRFMDNDHSISLSDVWEIMTGISDDEDDDFFDMFNLKVVVTDK